MENTIQTARGLFEEKQYIKAEEVCAGLVDVCQGRERREAFLIAAKSFVVSLSSSQKSEQRNLGLQALQVAINDAETVEEVKDLVCEFIKAMSVWEEQTKKRKLAMTEQEPTFEHWKDTVLDEQGYIEIVETIAPCVVFSSAVRKYKEEHGLDEAPEMLFSDLPQRFPHEEFQTLVYEAAMRIFNNTREMVEANVHADALYWHTRVGSILEKYSVAKLMVDFSISNAEDADQAIRSKRLKGKAEILDYILNAVTCPEGKTISLLHGEGRGEEIDELAGVYRQIQMIEPGYQPPELPNRVGFRPPAVNIGGGSGGCYVATSVYGSYDCPEVWTLRRFRDDTLAESWYGRAFIHLYYAISPTLVKWFGKTVWFKKLCKPALDRMVEKLNNAGVDNTAYSDKRW